MAARRKQKQASNSYNLRNRVEIPIELQAEDDSTFMQEFNSQSSAVLSESSDTDDNTCVNEFASQPCAGQVLRSSESSDTDTSSTDWNTVFQRSITGSDGSDSQTRVKRFKPRLPERVSQTKQKSDMSDQAVINDRILSQLDAINKRLNAMESSGSASGSVSKLHAAPRGKKRSMKTVSSNLKNSGDKSVKKSDVKLPDLKSIRHDRFIQQQVEERIKQLSGLDKKGIETKIKSLRGGEVDVYVKQRVKWPHEYVLAGNTKDRVTYNQLNITQWMAGFCRIMREETCESKDFMLDYLIALLDDANDFSWQSAKASHAVLLCRMEQGEITSWSETDKIDRIRRANAQKHTSTFQSSAPFQKSRKFQGQNQNQGQSQAKVAKTMPCIYYNDGSCSHQKHHETRGVYYKHICSTCFAHQGKSSAHSAGECRQKNSKNE